MPIRNYLLSSAALLALFMASGCKNEENPTTQPASEVVLKNQSVTPILAKPMRERSMIRLRLIRLIL